MNQCLVTISLHSLQRWGLYLLVFGSLGCLQSNNMVAAAALEPSPIHDFQSCVAAGYPVARSFPPQCHAGDGRVFMAEVAGLPLLPPSETEAVCQDLCGDGICQEVVCLAVGCPCPETPASCPADCRN